MNFQCDVARKRLKYAAEFNVSRRHNKILRAPNETNLFTCDIDEHDKQAIEYLSFMREKALIHARTEVQTQKEKE